MKRLILLAILLSAPAWGQCKHWSSVRVLGQNVTYCSDFRTMGTGVPAAGGCAAAADVGKIYIRTDAKAANASLYTCAQTGNGVFGWELGTAGAAGAGFLGSGTFAEMGASSPSAADVWVLTDAASPGVCSAGGGTSKALCVYTGAAWVVSSGMIAGGTTGQVPFQTAAGVTGFESAFAYNVDTNFLGLFGGVTLGQAGTATGSAVFMGTTSGSVTVKPNDVAGSGVVLTLPAATGTVARTADLPTITGSSPLKGSSGNAVAATYADIVGLWTTCTGYLKNDGTCDSPAGTGNVSSTSGAADPTAACTAGVDVYLQTTAHELWACTATDTWRKILVFDPSGSGSLTFSGATSGSATLGVADVAGTPNRLNVPTATGAAGGLLTTDGGNPQQTSWVTALPNGTTATTQSAADNSTKVATTAYADAVVPAASDTTAGKVELATTAETSAGNDTGRSVTPDGLAGSVFGEKVAELVVFDFTTDTATGDGKFYFVVPSSLNGMNLVSVTGQVITAGTTGTTDVQLARCATAASGNACSGTVTDMLSTKLTIDSGENSSATAATAAVIDAAADDVATGQIIRVDVDAVSTTAAKGLIVTLTFRLP